MNDELWEYETPRTDKCALCIRTFDARTEVVEEIRCTGPHRREQVWAYHEECYAELESWREPREVRRLTHYFGEYPMSDLCAPEIEAD